MKKKQPKKRFPKHKQPPIQMAQHCLVLKQNSYILHELWQEKDSLSKTYIMKHQISYRRRKLQDLLVSLYINKTSYNSTI